MTITKKSFSHESRGHQRKESPEKRDSLPFNVK